MVRLGLRLTLSGGREALLRLVVTVAAVAIGVGVLLGVFADFHAFQVTSDRPCWECTTAATGHPQRASSELWDYSESIYQGRFIEVLDVATLGPKAPVLPGLSRMPGAGEYFTSPALASLLAHVPAAQLGDRFPGQEVGRVGNAALSGPNELVAVVGYEPRQLSRYPGVITVTSISGSHQLQGTTGIYRMAFGIGAIIAFFPLAVLISTATRLSAGRREERFAAIRLVGGTPGQVNVVASVEAALGALLGAVAGCGVFLAFRPLLASISFSGQRFFSSFVTPTAAGYGLGIVGVPIAASAAAFLALRRIRVSPLGVSRRVTPPAPRAWRLVPIAVGVPMFIGSVATDPSGSQLALVYMGLLLTLVGLVMSGAWVTMMASRLLGHLARRPWSLLASRRLSDNPKGSFRTVSGLILAVFIGSVFATIAPALTAAQSRLGGAASLSDVLRDPYDGGGANGLPPARAAQLMARLAKFKGVSLVPIYANPAFGPNFAAGAPPQGPPPGSNTSQGIPPLAQPVHQASSSQYDSIISCRLLDELPVLGHCQARVAVVFANLNSLLLTDNPLFVAKDLPAVTASNPRASTADLGHLLLSTLLVKASSSAQLETVRTLITTFNATTAAGAGSGGGSLTSWQMGDLEPETFGEVAQIRNNDVKNAEDVILALVALTLLVAACSLAVTVCGGIVERKRPLTLLRVTGTPAATLRAMVMAEAAVPLLATWLLAALCGVGVGIPLVRSLPVIKREADAAAPDATYYLAMVAGLAVAMAVVSVSLPLLGRLTRTENARFE